MTWTIETVDPDRLPALLASVRKAGGTVTSCRPEADGVHVTWTAPTEAAPAGGHGAPPGRSG